MAKRILLIFTGVLVLLCAALLFIAGSETGTRWLAGKAQNMTGGIARWQQIDGRLLGPLAIRGLQMQLPGTAVTVASLQLDWTPGALLRGELAITRLAAQGVTVTLDAKEAPEEDSAPLDLASLQPPLDITLSQLIIEDITLHSGEAQAQRVDSLRLAAYTRDEQVVLQQLQIQAPQGSLDAHGTTALDNALPLELQADWQWRLADGRTLGGDLSADGNAQALQVNHTGSGDLAVNLRGELRSLLSQPSWQVSLDWPALPVDSSAQAIIAGPGSLASEGTLDQFTLQGSGELGGVTPQPLHWRLAADNGSAGGLHLNQLRLSTAPGVLELAGDIDWRSGVRAALTYRAHGEGLTAFDPGLPDRLDASGNLEAHYTDGSAQLEVFDLALEQTPLRLSLRAEAQLPADAAPLFEARLAWSGIAWPLVPAAEIKPAFSSAEGQIAASGSADDYRFTLGARSAGEQAPAAQWAAEGQGNSSGLQLTSLVAKLLGGELRLTGDVGWSPGISWQLQADGENLNPGQWRPDYPGKLALALHSSGRIDARAGPQAQLRLDYLKGVLGGQPFDLSLDAAIAGEAVDLTKLSLHSGANTLDAHGQLSSEKLALQWQLDAPQPHTLLPGAMGRLQGSGSISGTAEKPRLTAHLEGDQLAYEHQSLDLLRADIEAGLAANAPLLLELQIDNLIDAEQTLVESVRLSASGSTGAHQLSLAVQTPGDVIAAQLSGGLDSAAIVWRGTLAGLHATSAGFGEWNLDAPAAMQISAKQQNVEQICLSSADDEAKVCASGGYSGSSGGQFALQLAALPLARFIAAVDGELNGGVEGSLGADGTLSGNGRITLSAGELRLGDSGNTSIAYRGGEMNLTLTPDAGLDSQLTLEGERQRLLDASLQLPQLRKLPLADAQPLAGQLNADINDLAGLAALVPELEAVSGRLFADLQVAGDLSAPQLQGRLALENGAAHVLPAGLQLEQINLALAGDPQRPGYLYLSGGAKSGPGSIALDGQFNIQGQQLDLRINGERLEVWDTRDGRALLSPDLAIQWDGELATVRGRLEIPRADITPKLAISPGMAGEEEIQDTPAAQVIATSADVVILGPQGKPIEEPGATLPFRLDSQVELVLGERVRVNALGFKGRIAGAVKFVNQPRRRELIPIADGRFSIEDGTFRAFGQDLEIETGQVIFDRVPATEPEIALRAVRWIDNDPLVSAAGVQVSGPLEQPLLELFSRPQLDPAEIQSYLLPGHSANSDDSALGFGTYLHPKLYVGYGYNLIAETSEFDALYTITPRYGVEVTVGEADNRVNLTFTHEN